MIDDPRRWLTAPYPGFFTQVGASFYAADADGRLLAWPWDAPALLGLGCVYATTEVITVDALPNLPIELNLAFTLPEVPDAPVAPSSTPSTEEDTPEHG